MEDALHPVVGGKSQWSPRGKGKFVPFPCGCFAAPPALECWIGLGPRDKSTEDKVVQNV